MNTTTRWRRREMALLVGLLLAAFGLRLVGLDEAPPGLRYDELQNHLMAGRVLAGERPLYFAESWGHEPLYHYLQAGAMSAWGESDWSLRLPSVFLGLLAVVATWLVARRLFGRRVALLAVAFMTVSFWAIFYSRIGSRVGSTTFFVALMVYFLWQTVEPGRRRGGGWPAALAGGLFMGLAVYVYVAGRVTFGIFTGFIIYLVLLHQSRIRQSWQRLLLFGVIGVLTAVPLFVELRRQPALEQRLDLLNQPLHALQQGDPLPVLDLSARALGMYFFQGEQDWLYNVSGRPIFDMLTAALFLLGVGLALWRWRRSRYALMLIWLLMGTAPAMLAPPEASLTHTIAAQPVAFILLALGVDGVWRWLARRQPLWGPLFAAALLVIFAAGSLTAYFLTWQRAPEVRELYQGGLTAVATAFQEDDPPGPVVVGAPFVDYWQPWNAVSFDLALVADVSDVRWFNPAGSWVWPAGDAPATYYFPTAPLAAQQYELGLEGLFLRQAEALPVEGDDFRAFRLATATLLDEQVAAAAVATSVTWPPDLAQLPETAVPLNFGDRLQLLAVELPQQTVTPGETLQFVSYWRVLQADPSPLVAFAHVTSDGVDIWGQQDWLDVRMDGLQPGDRFVQQHRLAVSPDTPSGDYHIQLGLYGPDTLVRVPIRPEIGSDTADRVWLGSIDVSE